MLYACTTLFRGAGYVSFDGELPEQPLHGAMNAAYAHATAPLRRLVDRYVGALCEALCAGDPVPEWIRETLEATPDFAPSAELMRSLAYVTQISPTFSLRGGTRQIMRGIIARGLGLEVPTRAGVEDTIARIRRALDRQAF